MQSDKTWQDYDTLKALRIPELTDILQQASIVSETEVDKLKMRELAERFRAWSLSAQDDLTQYFRDYHFISVEETKAVADSYGIDLTKEADFIRFYYADFVMAALLKLAGPNPTAEQLKPGEKLLEKLQTMSVQLGARGLT